MERLGTDTQRLSDLAKELVAYQKSTASLKASPGLRADGLTAI